jgi:hypothetical protein
MGALFSSLGQANLPWTDCEAIHKPSVALAAIEHGRGVAQADRDLLSRLSVEG